VVVRSRGLVHLCQEHLSTEHMWISAYTLCYDKKYIE
jgi:hypothetical protein